MRCGLYGDEKMKCRMTDDGGVSVVVAKGRTYLISTPVIFSTKTSTHSSDTKTTEISPPAPSIPRIAHSNRLSNHRPPSFIGDPINRPAFTIEHRSPKYRPVNRVGSKLLTCKKP